MAKEQEKQKELLENELFEIRDNEATMRNEMSFQENNMKNYTAELEDKEKLIDSTQEENKGLREAITRIKTQLEQSINEQNTAK